MPKRYPSEFRRRVLDPRYCDVVRARYEAVALGAKTKVAA